MPKLTPPDRYEFTRTLPIAALNDTEAECLFVAGTNEFHLITATICGKVFVGWFLYDWFGASEVSLLEAMASDWWQSEGWAAAEQDWLASVADAQNEARDDE